MTAFLLVDDHAIIRTGLKLLILQSFPHSIIDEANDGNAAFELLKKCDYDLVVMDIHMPNTDSFGIIQTILTLKPALKIIMFSVNDEEIYAKRYLEIGAMGYLNKDASTDEIIKTITLVLNNRKYISGKLNEKLLSDLQSNCQSDHPFDKLSSRQFQIVQHLAHGDSVSKIAEKLNLDTSTIGTHKGRIFKKLGCCNVIDLNKLAKVYNIVLRD